MTSCVLFGRCWVFSARASFYLTQAVQSELALESIEGRLKLAPLALATWPTIRLVSSQVELAWSMLDWSSNWDSNLARWLRSMGALRQRETEIIQFVKLLLLAKLKLKLEFELELELGSARVKRPTRTTLRPSFDTVVVVVVVVGLFVAISNSNSRQVEPRELPRRQNNARLVKLVNFLALNVEELGGWSCSRGASYLSSPSYHFFHVQPWLCLVGRLWKRRQLKVNICILNVHWRAIK